MTSTYTRVDLYGTCNRIELLSLVIDESRAGAWKHSRIGKSKGVTQKGLISEF